MIMKTTLLKTLLLVFALCFASSYLSAQTLTAHYKFDNSLNDETGNWDLSPSSGFTPTFETGQDGTENGAVSGFGAANFLQTATNFDISGNTSRSMTAWVKVSNTVSGGTAILGTGIRNSAGERWSFLIDPAARPRVEIQGQGFNNDPNTVEIDTWAHVAVVWDASVNSGGATGGESVKLYLNGQPGNTATWTDNDVMTAVSRLRIGNDFNSQTPARGFQGALDDIQIYEGALTDAQVLDIYNGDPICVSPANLTASNVTGTSADLSWDNEGVASGGYEYFVTSDGTVPNSSTTPTGTVGASTTTTTLSGLNEGTSYKVYIRSLCNGSDVSEYSEPLTITTPLSDPILVAHYKFNNSLDDETGNWDLSPSSGFTPTFETGQNGTENGAISGFGDSDFLETATDFVISGNTSRTMTAWVRVDDDTRFNAILGLGTPVQNPGGRRWTFGVNPNRNSRVEIQGEGLNNEAESIDLGVWVHLAVTFDSNSNLTQLYLNGEPGDSDFFPR